MPSLGAAFAMTCSIKVTPAYARWLCARRVGVFVRTETPRHRMATGWYKSETIMPVI